MSGIGKRSAIWGAICLAGMTMWGIRAVTGAATAEGDPMSVDAASASCLQLRDSNTWTTYTNNLSGVGTPWTLANLVTNGMNRQGPILTSATRPFAPSTAVGYKGGFQWDSGDQAVTYWIPQGMTAGVSGGRNVVIVAWHYPLSGPDKGVRVSIADVTDMGASHVPYRHALLVEPSTSGNYVPVPVHGGGLAWVGNYLYMVDTANGIRVFDLTQIREVDTPAACDAAIGDTGSLWCAYGYRFIIPQVSRYAVPATKSDGTPISASCKPKFSFMGKDTRNSPVLLTGEFCNTTDQPCVQDPAGSPGMGGRLYRWALNGTTNRLQTVSTYISPSKAYKMNERNIQGVAPVMLQFGGAYAPDTYWLSATRRSGALFSVSQTDPVRALYADQSEWPWVPEGMHATSTGTNLWTATEGRVVSGTLVTDPRTGGRVVVFMDQADVH